MKHAAVKLIQWILRGLVWICFRPCCRYESELARREAFREPCVIISNHIRGFDGAAVFTLLPGKKITALVARDMLDKSAALRKFFFCLPLHVIDREHASLGWLRDSRRLLREGSSIYLCPEGRCNFDRDVREFKPGFALLAASAGVKVVPVYHNGEYHILFGRRFRMMVGEPYTVAPPPEGVSPEVLAAEAHDARGRVRALEKKLNGFVREPKGERET